MAPGSFSKSSYRGFFSDCMACAVQTRESYEFKLLTKQGLQFLDVRPELSSVETAS